MKKQTTVLRTQLDAFTGALLKHSVKVIGLVGYCVRGPEFNPQDIHMKQQYGREIDASKRKKSCLREVVQRTGHPSYSIIVI